MLRAIDKRATGLPGGPGGPNDPRDPWIWFGYWIRTGGDIKLEEKIDIRAFEPE